jgi:HD-GYP domain-containing protein (c-di-GMP phosphodiesterase class II)
MTNMSNNFFSVSFDLIILDKALPYDLYVNSSANHERERFVRIYPKNDPLSHHDLKLFKKKYFQLYIHEFQRADYLKSMISLSGATDIQKGDIIKSSAIHYLDKLFSDDKEFTTELLSETISECKVAVESMVDVIKDYDVSKLQGLIASLSFHDFYTYDHSINVSMYCISLFTAAKPNASKEEIVMAGLGGLLHDIGKIKISTDIINKPEKLSDEEFNVIKAHPTYGLELLTDNPCPDCHGVDFNIIRRVVHEHHENFNGTGYPKKISGPDIHLLARITAIADFFDAITTKRSYHEVMSTEDAIAVMSKSVGKKIDPQLFEIFTKSLKQLVLAGKINKELPDDFDPCQPQNVLPFRTPMGFKVEGFGDKGATQEKFGKVRKKVG